MNTQRSLAKWDKLGILSTIVTTSVGVALITATTAPVSAQSVVVGGQGFSYGVVPTSGGSSFIYGSPIPTPILVNPNTGLLPRTNYYSYPGRRTIENSTLLNPILVNPRIRDSTLINPVIINNSGRRRSGFTRSRIIYSYPY